MSHIAMKMKKINGAAQRKGFSSWEKARKAGYCLAGNYRDGYFLV